MLWIPFGSNDGGESKIDFSSEEGQEYQALGTIGKDNHDKRAGGRYCQLGYAPR